VSAVTIPWAAYFGAFLIGIMVGVAELLSRHRDYPLVAISTLPSFGYLALNGILALFALLVLAVWRPEWLLVGAPSAASPMPPLDTLKAALVAGFGAAAFFRSSLFKVRTPDGDLSFGPAIVIDVFLRVIDDAVDRTLGAKRLDDAAAIMRGVDFEKAAKSLPTYCFAALKRLSPEAQQQFAFQLKALQDAPSIDPTVKTISLGLAIMALVGRAILQKAVDQLGPSIK
jgi:hypothetical protein